jgi:NAD(P)-dependent dehydrogenase (short-subunit alcohol dehydrogenase family)
MKPGPWGGLLDGQTALVTGAGSGIGEAVARALHAAGARVVLFGRTAGALEALAAGLDPSLESTRTIVGDVARSKDADAAVQYAVEAFGQLDILVHCAGVSPVRLAMDCTDEDWLDVINTNLNGAFFMSRAAGRTMKGREGSIVLLASDAGLHGAKDLPAYAASKGGVIALMKSLAQELGPHGVRVNAINPGVTDTPMSRKSLSDDVRRSIADADPLGELSTPQDIAEVVMFLVGPARSFMTGQLVTTRVRMQLASRDGLDAKA